MSCLPMWDFLMKRDMDMVFKTYTDKSWEKFYIRLSMVGSINKFKSCLSIWDFPMKRDIEMIF